MARIWGEALLGGHRAGRLPALGEQVVKADAYEFRTRAAWATGSVLVISRACRAAVGEWDERYFLYSEEYRLRAARSDHGFALQLQPRARCIHDAWRLPP